MGNLQLTGEATASPSASTAIIQYNSTTKRIQAVIEDGSVHTLSPSYQDRNVIMNGGFAIQQRMAVASTAIAGITTTTRGGVVSDRWAVTTSVASSLNWQQVDTSGSQESGLNEKYYGSIIASTAGKKVMLSQFIINREMAHLRGQKVRLQVKTNQKVGASQTYKLGLLQLTSAGTVDVSPAFLSGAWSVTTGVDPAWNTNISPITPDASPTGDGGTITGNFLNITSSQGAWLRSSCTFTVPLTAKNLYIVLFSDATGGTTDNISVGEFGLYQGAEIRDWAAERFIDQLTACQAYYCKSFPYATAPVTNGGLAGALKGICVIAGAVALAAQIFWRYPVEMWKAPVTNTIYNPSIANNQVRRYSGTATDQTASAFTNLTASGTEITATGDAAGVIGSTVAAHATVDAEIVN